MRIFARLKIAAVSTVVIMGISMVIDIIFSTRLGEITFSDWFTPLVFVACLLAAPAIDRMIPYKMGPGRA